MTAVPAPRSSFSLSGFAARLSVRERRLLALLALVALVVAPVVAVSRMQDAKSRNIEAQAALEQAQGGGRGGLTADLVRSRQQIRAWSWQAATPEIGRVIVQDSIRRIAAEAGMSEVDLRSSDRIETAGEVSFVRVDLSANFDWKSFTAFLSGLGAYGKGFMVESMNVQDNDKPKLRMTLKMPVIAPVAAP